MTVSADEAGQSSAGAAHRVAQRSANAVLARSTRVKRDAQGLVEFRCECMDADCQRSVRVPLYVYERVLAANDQYLVQAGHHAFPRNRTIVTSGLMRIEERA